MMLKGSKIYVDGLLGNIYFWALAMLMLVVWVLALVFFTRVALVAMLAGIVWIIMLPKIMK